MTSVPLTPTQPRDARRRRPVVVVATANPDKVVEIREILACRLDVELLGRPVDIGDVEETGDTLLENARLKAEAICAATGHVAIADDTGLEVDALRGAPGVNSARYSGPNATYASNVKRLLSDLCALQDHGGSRRARFRTVALAVFPDGAEIHAEGVVAGHIADAPRGTGGFGYDPVFVPDEGRGHTFAEMGPTEKHAISHRGRAFRALAAQLATRLKEPVGS
ncbi:MAG: RdgB/HAM1 family non-canonical purine NTP pyrophosphatase [Actinobacteria bacterium]|nr:RdgB/HAM1 family non-canonical purine NTP pyrophosphatase [Actinomycetota bacterium]